MCKKSSLQMRPTLPLGQSMALGDCGYIEDNAFRYLGTSDTMLGVPAGDPIPGKSQQSVEIVSGKDVNITVHAKGEPSAAFNIVIDAEAAVEITFASSKSFFIAAENVHVFTMKDPVILLAALLKLFNVGAWQKHFCFIYQIGVASSYSAALSHESSAKLLLNADVNLAPVEVSIASLAAGVKFARQSGSVERIIAKRDVTAFYNAYRIKDRFFSGPTVKTAAKLGPDAPADTIRKALDVADNPFQHVEG
ncbi:hypothetical protein [Mycolicibacterium tusciae]|uniref:hypothetical protein n=1 Tax=Mycolicibacterium tusciae TaxID=75922 RepID=UPI0011E57E5B|nr:hypothetical protein [Mycolicibacterium tusciae]